MSKDFRFDKYDDDDQFETSDKYARRAHRHVKVRKQKRRHAELRHVEKGRDDMSHQMFN